MASPDDRLTKEQLRDALVKAAVDYHNATFLVGYDSEYIDITRDAFDKACRAFNAAPDKPRDERAEIERLRTALRSMACWKLIEPRCTEIAEAALAGTHPPENQQAEPRGNPVEQKLLDHLFEVHHCNCDLTKL